MSFSHFTYAHFIPFNHLPFPRLSSYPIFSFHSLISLFHSPPFPHFTLIHSPNSPISSRHTFIHSHFPHFPFSLFHSHFLYFLFPYFTHSHTTAISSFFSTSLLSNFSHFPTSLFPSLPHFLPHFLRSLPLPQAFLVYVLIIYFLSQFVSSFFPLSKCLPSPIISVALPYLLSALNLISPLPLSPLPLSPLSSPLPLLPSNSFL